MEAGQQRDGAPMLALTTTDYKGVETWLNRQSPKLPRPAMPLT